jgi:hypothetical protein
MSCFSHDYNSTNTGSSTWTMNGTATAPAVPTSGSGNRGRALVVDARSGIGGWLDGGSIALSGGVQWWSDLEGRRSCVCGE